MQEFIDSDVLTEGAPGTRTHKRSQAEYEDTGSWTPPYVSTRPTKAGGGGGKAKSRTGDLSEHD